MKYTYLAMSTEIVKHRTHFCLLESIRFFFETWEDLGTYNEGQSRWCVCALMGKVYILGGFKELNGYTTNSCIEFNTNDCHWRKMSEMNGVREYSACSIFEGKVEVSGVVDGDEDIELKTVEVFDHVAE